MDTVCEEEMYLALHRLGATGCIHRFMSIEEQRKQVERISKEIFSPVIASVGANGDFLERAKEMILGGANIILIDVAHGHHENVRIAIEKIKSIANVDIIAGNIATKEAAIDLQDWGADALRVGIGGGSLCTTRVKTGFGIPNVTCIQEISYVAKVPIIADGGIRTSGDISKALAVGADSVMLGSILAGTRESPGKMINTSSGVFKRYRGAASLETKSVHGMETRNVEGESTTIPYKGNVSDVIEDITDGVRSALSYAGAENLSSYHPDFIQVTNAGQLEARPHLIK
jgi:IMP dehydrogenase